MIVISSHLLMSPSIQMTALDSHSFSLRTVVVFCSLDQLPMRRDSWEKSRSLPYRADSQLLADGENGSWRQLSLKSISHGSQTQPARLPKVGIGTFMEMFAAINEVFLISDEDGSYHRVTSRIINSASCCTPSFIFAFLLLEKDDVSIIRGACFRWMAEISKILWEHTTCYWLNQPTEINNKKDLYYT